MSEIYSGAARFAGEIITVAVMCARNRLRCLRLFGHMVLLTALLLPGQAILAAGENIPVFRRLVEQVNVTVELQMLQGVCDQGAVKMRKGVGRCAVCPSYTSAVGGKNGFTVTELISGSFTSGNQREVLLNMEGCESGADLGGGMVLLRHADSGWTRLYYQKGLRLRNCFKYQMQADNHELICNQSVFTRDGEMGQVLQVTLTEESLQAVPLVRWFDNAASNPRRLVTVFPSQFQRIDFNQDGNNDLHILFRIREETIPEEYAGVMEAIDAGYELGVPRMRGLVYLFDGKSFSLAEDSIEVLEEINGLLAKYSQANTH